MAIGLRLKLSYSSYLACQTLGLVLEFCVLALEFFLVLAISLCLKLSYRSYLVRQTLVLVLEFFDLALEFFFIFYFLDLHLVPGLISERLKFLGKLPEDTVLKVAEVLGEVFMG